MPPLPIGHLVPHKVSDDDRGEMTEVGVTRRLAREPMDPPPSLVLGGTETKPSRLENPSSRVKLTVGRREASKTVGNRKVEYQRKFAWDVLCL